MESSFFKKFANYLINRTTLVLILFVCLNLLFKFYYLPQESIYGDEAYSIFHAQKPLNELTEVFLHDQNPPLHILILHFWMQIFGISDVSAKALSVILSALCALVLFVFSKRFLNKKMAILVSVLFLFSNVQLFYSHEIRTYALVELLCIVSFYYYFKLIKETNKMAIPMLTIINLLLLFSHYLTIFIFITQFVCVWMFYKQNKKGVWYYIISQLLVVIVFIPWLKVLFANLPQNGSFWLSAPGYGELQWFVFMLNGNRLLFQIFSTIILCSLLMIVFNKRFHFFKAEFDVRIYILFLAWYLLPIALDYRVAQYTPVFLGRYFLYSTLGLFLLIAYIIGNLNSPPLILAFISIFILWNLLITFDMKPEKEDEWKSIVPKIKHLQDKKTAIFISASYKYKEFSFYYDRAAFIDYNNTIKRLYDQNVFCSKEGLFGWGEINLDSINQILFVQSHSQFEDPEGRIKQSILDKNFNLCNEYPIKNVKLSVFKRIGQPCFLVKIIKTQNASDCSFWETNIGIQEQTKDTVIIYKTGMEIISTSCPLPHSINKEKVKSGNYSCKINKEDQYSIGLTKTVKELGEKKEINVSAFVNYEIGSTAHIVVSVEKKSKTLYRQDLIISEMNPNPNVWNKIILSAIIPKNISDDAELKIYFWNPSGKAAFVDDFTVQFNPSF